MKNDPVVTRFAEFAPQFLAAISATFSAISDGMHYGWTSPVIEILERNDTHIHLTQTDHTWLESIHLIGGLSGIPSSIYFVNKFGRKNCILVAAFIAMISWILIAIADNVIYLYVARFIVGFTGDVAFIASPMYISEIAHEKLRGFLTGLVYIMMLVGILLIYSVAPYTSFYVPSIVGGALLLTQIMTLPFMPDSPYYLISTGKEEKAKKHLKRLRGGGNIDGEFTEILEAMKRQETEKGRLLDLIKTRSNRKALLIMIVLNMAQHFSSISVMLMNLHPILTAADSIYLSSNVSGIVFSAIMLVGAVLADCVVDKFGRKFLLIVSSLCTAVSLLVLAVYFTLQRNQYDVKPFSWIPIASVMIYGFVFKLGMGIVPCVLVAELFSSKVKAVGMTVAGLFYVLGAWITIEIYLRLVDYAGYDYPFYIFASCCFFIAIFTQFYVPETKGKTLDEIQFLLNGIPFPSVSSKSDSSTYISDGVTESKIYNGTELSFRETFINGKKSNGRV